MVQNDERIESQGFKISDFIQGDTGNRITNALVMWDKFSSSDLYKKGIKAYNTFVSYFLITPGRVTLDFCAVVDCGYDFLYCGVYTHRLHVQIHFRVD